MTPSRSPLERGTVMAGRPRAQPLRTSSRVSPRDPRPWTNQRLVGAGGLVAVIRLIAVPLFFAAERLVAHPIPHSAPFDAVLAAAAVYAVLAFLAELRGRALAAPWILGVADLGIISALVATSGGPFSELRHAFFVLPVGAALVMSPRATLAASVAIVAVYSIIALTYPVPQAARTDASRFEVTQILFLAWTGGAATLLSMLLARRRLEVEALADELAALAETRGRLVAQALDAEDMARRRLAEALHDEALQNVLAARQELGAGDDAELDLIIEALDRTSSQLREAVFDLHPYLLEQAGLGTALAAIAERGSGRRGFRVQVDVDADALGEHDQLLFSIGRELITNVEKHAGASKLWLALRRRGASVELTVSDDGRGIDLDEAVMAPRAGHIGLASSAERVDAVGGDFHVGPGPDGRGTLVSVRLPLSHVDSTAA